MATLVMSLRIECINRDVICRLFQKNRQIAPRLVPSMRNDITKTAPAATEPGTLQNRLFLSSLRSCKLPQLPSLETPLYSIRCGLVPLSV